MAEKLSHNEDEPLVPTPEVEKEISLRDILTYDNPNLPQYQKLIERERRERRHYLPQAFSRHWAGGINVGLSDEEKMQSFFKNKLGDGILVDVGGGTAKIIEGLAAKSGVAKYINVDVMRESSPDPYAGHKTSSTRSMETIDVRADMLDFIARLPDSSCNFSVNGIDINVIVDNEYRRALINELIRATKIGGIMFGAGSDIWKEDPRIRLVPPKEFGGFELEEEPSLGYNLEEEAVFEKVAEK